MQVNLNNILSGNKDINSIYKSEKQYGTGSMLDVQVSDEYVIRSAFNISDEAVEKHTKKENHTPMQLAIDDINKLASNIGADEFDKFEELGITPEEDELGHIVTVSDRIKIRLAVNCENYKGDVSDIDMAELEQVYGNIGSAQMANGQLEALDIAKDLKNISDNEKAYLLKNEMKPTIENVYMAQHSGTVNSVSKLTDSQWEELKPQVEAIADKVGIQVNEEMFNEGRFLIENGISLTPQNLVISMEMNADIEGKTEGQWINDMTKTIALGMNAKDTNVTGYIPDKFMAQDIVSAIENGNEEQIDAILSNGKEVTVLNLKNPPTLEEIKEKISEERTLAAKEKMQEICQKMSYESCMHMLKQGIKVEIMTFDELSVQIDEYNQQTAKIFISEPTDKNVELFNDTITAMEMMRSVPNAILGKIVSGEAEFTVKSITTTEISTYKYEEIESLYDAVGTEVRKDLGDSLKRAFESSYSLLDDIGINISESSKRAVRILGYNSMEVTRDNVLEVQALDEQIAKLFRNFTPQATAYIIENGINPLETDIVTLNENLVALNEELGYANTESFSKYLWRLDKNKSISKEDREAYIGLYKLIRQIEKGDRRVVGAVVKSGKEMNLKNLYRELQNNAYKGTETEVDDSLGLTESVAISETNLSKQLSHFEKIYDGMIDKIWKYSTPENIQKIGIDEYQNLPIEQLADMVDENRTDEEYIKMRVEEIQSARYVSESEIELLMNSDTRVSVSNMLATSYMMSSPNGVWGKLKKDNEKFLEKFKDVDIDNIDEEYENATKEMHEVLMEQSADYDVKQFRMFKRVLNVLGSAAKKQSYFVPFEINGQTSTMKVVFVDGTDDKGKVSIEIYSEVSGRVAAQFRMTEKGVTGNVLCESREGLQISERAISNMELEYGEIKVEKGIVEHIREGIFKSEKHEKSQATKSELYHVAKTFIHGIKG